MKIYAFGDKNKPAIMLFPGTCCYWKTNFGHVLEPLQEHFLYDGGQLQWI